MVKKNKRTVEILEARGIKVDEKYKEVPEDVAKIPFSIFFNKLIKENRKFKKHHYDALKTFCQKFPEENSLEEWFEIVKKY